MYSIVNHMKETSTHILKKAGLKVTKPRTRILDLFSEECKPMNVEAVVSLLKKDPVDTVTVYRTLESFREAGIIKIVDLRKNSTFYELNHSHHHHITCTSCGAVEGFELCDIEITATSLLQKSRMFKRITDHSLELFGLCKSCAKA